MGWKPSLWASVIPRDPTERKPNHYAEMLRVAWENRDQLPFAWRILKHGVCDGCALGTTGLRDWTMDGVHLCIGAFGTNALEYRPSARSRSPQRRVITLWKEFAGPEGARPRC